MCELFGYNWVFGSEIVECVYIEGWVICLMMMREYVELKWD